MATHPPSTTCPASTTDALDFAQVPHHVRFGSPQSSEARLSQPSGDLASDHPFVYPDNYIPMIPESSRSQETFRSDRSTPRASPGIRPLSNTPRSDLCSVCLHGYVLGPVRLAGSSLASGYTGRNIYETTLSLSNGSESSRNHERGRQTQDGPWVYPSLASTDMKVAAEAPEYAESGPLQSTDSSRQWTRDEMEQEPCPSNTLDRFVKCVVDGFTRWRCPIGLAALCLGSVTLIIMIALLPLSKAKGNTRFARMAFEVCDAIMSLCCGIFVAAIGRSVGEAGLLMIAVLCYGMLFSNHLDTVLGMGHHQWPDN